VSGEAGTHYHLGRLLVLLRHFAPFDGKPLQGLTKLAKLDFLLRYPAFTDMLLAARGLSWPLGAEPSEAESLAVESRMIRYKYGPWDNRYYPLLGALVGLGLAETSQKGRRNLIIRLSAEGTARATNLARTDEWEIVDLRAKLLHDSFDTSGTKLKDMIYSELPEVVNRPHWTEI